MSVLLLNYIEIHPNAFATELIRIIAAKIGQMYLIITQKIFFLRNVPSPCKTSASTALIPAALDTRRQIMIAAIGIITEFVRKSKKSRNCKYKCSFLTIPSKLILKCGNCTLSQRNRACYSCK